ncbi:MAG: hypothetical protein WCW44_06045 [archaeon]|jgi:hypothetical protein
MVKNRIPGLKMSTLASNSPDGKLESVHFDFKVGFGSFADPMFFSSPALREVLTAHPLKEGARAGFISYTSSGGHVEQAVYPFRYLDGTPLSGKLNRKGIASELEKRTLRVMIKKYGDLKLVPFMGLTRYEGAKMLLSRGILRELGPWVKPVKTKRMQEAISATKRRRKRLTQMMKR